MLDAVWIGGGAHRSPATFWFHFTGTETTAVLALCHQTQNENKGTRCSSRGLLSILPSSALSLLGRVLACVHIFFITYTNLLINIIRATQDGGRDFII